MSFPENLTENNSYTNIIDEENDEVEGVILWAIDCARELEDEEVSSSASRASNLLLDYFRNEYNSAGVDISRDVTMEVEEAYEIADREMKKMAHSSYRKWGLLYHVCSEIEEIRDYKIK